MDAVPIVPPLFRATKNTTLHELQTGDTSRATDTRGLRRLQIQKYPAYTLSASGLSSNHQEVVLAKQLSLIRSPDALKLCEICGLGSHAQTTRYGQSLLKSMKQILAGQAHGS